MKKEYVYVGLAALLIGGYLFYVNYIKNGSNNNTSNLNNATPNTPCITVTYSAPVYNNAIVTYKDCNGNSQTENITTGNSITIQCLQGSDSIKYIPISASSISFTSPFVTGEIDNNKVVVANAVQTMYNAPSDATLVVNYTDIYGNPASTTIPAGGSSYIDCVKGTDSVQVLPIVINVYTTKPNTISLVTYNDVSNTPQLFYVIDKSVNITNPSSPVYTSPYPIKIIKGSDNVKVMEYDTKTYTAPIGKSLTVNYTDWGGNEQQLFIFNGSSTINCVKGSDSIVSTTPYDFTTPVKLNAVPTLGSIINSSYNLPSSVSNVCPIGQPCTQDCIDAINKEIQHDVDLLSQRYIKMLQGNGNNTNSVTTQLEGNVGSVINAFNFNDPNMVKILSQMYSSTLSQSSDSVSGGGNSGNFISGNFYS